jgi:hypothetical protein
VSYTKTGIFRSPRCFDQRLHVFPVEAADARREARQRERGERLLFRDVAQLAQRSSHARSFAAGLAVVPAAPARQVDDALLAGPRPRLAGLGVRNLTVMPEILDHGGPPLTQTEGEARVEVITRRDAMGDGAGLTLQNVSTDEVDHVLS